MSAGHDVYRFGPFELDSAHRRLLCQRQPVALPDRHTDVLLLLVSQAGHVVSKEAIVKSVWRDVAVTDNTLERAIWNLRKTLGSKPGTAPYIETLVRIGYRFAAPVERATPARTTGTLDALLAPYRAFVDGRAALETLNRGEVIRARHAFEDAIAAAPESPSAHIGLANACVLAFEATRADVAPDLASLQQADWHAREGCRLAPDLGEAWSTLAFVRHRLGDGPDAIAAVRRAVSLEPNDWRHHMRLASIGWGEERLRAAACVLMLCPSLGLAHWFSATVLVAREAFDAALTHLRAGCDAQDAQRKGTARFHAVGLHLLHGLVLAARGSLDEALGEFERELAANDEGQLYARECAANTWYASGAVHLRQGRPADAAAAFETALEYVPGHPFASVGVVMDAAPGLAACMPSDADVPGMVWRPGRNLPGIDAAMVHAVTLTFADRHDEAARVCGDALATAAPGSAGWMMPVEPLLHVGNRGDTWRETLATLRHRAI